MATPWTIAAEWVGKTCFIVAGGPSAADAGVARLAPDAAAPRTSIGSAADGKRKVIAINSSYVIAPFADILFFADERWWRGEPDRGIVGHRDRKEFQAFAAGVSLRPIGRPEAIPPMAPLLVTTSPHVHDDRVLRLRRGPPPGLAEDRSTVTLCWTSVTAAINIAVHLGVVRIVLIGVDGGPGPAPDCRTHHHEPHPWPARTENWGKQAADLVSLAGPLATRGIIVLNACPDSAIFCWPRMTLTDALTVIR